MKRGEKKKTKKRKGPEKKKNIYIGPVWIRTRDRAIKGARVLPLGHFFCVTL